MNIVPKEFKRFDSVPIADIWDKYIFKISQGEAKRKIHQLM